MNGKNYETWLNPPEDFERIASLAREEFLARKQNPEGATVSPKKETI